MIYKWKKDCKSFIGVYACDTLKAENYKSCEECRFYDPISKKILIIKLGAMGDVLRTTTILQALKEKYGSNISITWLVKQESKELLENNPYIDRILVYNFENALKLQQEKFDVLISLDIDPPSSLIANTINAKEKFGYFYDNGFPSAFNRSAEYYLERAFSDFINKNNRKTYQEMMFEAVELPYKKQDYIFNLSKEDVEYSKKFAEMHNLKQNKIIGINIGSANRWSSKSWAKEKIIELINKLHENNYNVLILGGKQEEELQKELLNKFIGKIISNNPENTVREFASVINLCDAIITGDTLALHIAAALKKKTIALFFCTPPWEIEDYSIIQKITSPLLDKHLFNDQYSEELVNSISISEVYKEIENLF